MKYMPKDGFPYYFDLVADTDCISLFSSKANFRYTPDKWSIKQLVGHITDHERIKMFRAF